MNVLGEAKKKTAGGLHLSFFSFFFFFDLNDHNNAEGHANDCARQDSEGSA
jgi:hypothetical protein